MSLVWLSIEPSGGSCRRTFTTKVDGGQADRSIRCNLSKYPIHKILAQRHDLFVPQVRLMTGTNISYRQVLFL